jgi:tetratricopeptide (TPR) repeat protein
MFRRHPVKFLLVAAVVAIGIWLRFRTVPIPPGDHLKMGLEALEAGQFSSAEQHFREELRLESDQPVASEELALLLIRSGRHWEASPYVRTTLEQQRIRQQSLLRISGDPDQSIDKSMLNNWHRQSPEDIAPLIGLARIALRRGDTNEAHELLDRILALSPNELEAHVIKGQAELTTGLSRLSDWNSQLPKGAERHPGIWFVRGEWSQQAGNPEMATRCFLEGVLLNPNDRNLNLRLGQLLGEEKGQPFLAHAETLRRVFNAVAYIERQKSYSQMLGLLKSLQSLGRFREATQWGQTAMSSDPDLMMRMTKDPGFSSEYRGIIAAAPTKKEFNPALNIDLKTFPEWSPPAEVPGSQNTVLTNKDATGTDGSRNE